MATLPSSPTWSPDVYQIETTDAVLGGPDGAINVQAKQLADRTVYLKQEVEAAGAVADGADAKADSALAQIDSIETAAGSAQTNAAEALAHKQGAQAAQALAEQARNAAQAAQAQAGDNAGFAYQAAQTAQQKAAQTTADATTAASAAATAVAASNTAVTAKNAAVLAAEAAEAALAQILYQPPDITALLISGAASRTEEVGSSVADVTLSWTLTGSAPNFQTISNSVGSVPVGLTSKTVNGPFTTSQSWTLTVADTSPSGEQFSDSASVALNFRQRRYWGVSAAASLDSTGILGLGGSEFSTSKGKTVTYNATGGRYIYYAYPASFGAIASATVGGLPFSDFTESLVNFTNASGFTESYRVVRFNSLQNGASIQVVWA